MKINKTLVLESYEIEEILRIYCDMKGIKLKSMNKKDRPFIKLDFDTDTFKMEVEVEIED